MTNPLSNDLCTIRSAALPSGIQVAAFVGREAMSTPYAFDVALRLTGLDLDPSTVVGERATLTMDRGLLQAPFVFHGIIASAEVALDYNGFGLYIARIVPALWQLGLTCHSRVFTDNSIPAIIEAVLKDSGVMHGGFRLALQADYPDLEHVCQYRESNFAFVSRLMEREGMYYFFEQGDDREIMVITDTRSAHTSLSDRPVRYFAATADDVTQPNSLRTFRSKTQALPANVALKDYNYLKPGLDVSGVAKVSQGPGDIVLYGENFQTPKEGKHYAKLRAEELLARQTVFSGSGRQFYLRPGYNFTLEEHTRPVFNTDYTAIAVEHVQNQAIDAEMFRELFGTESHEVYCATVHAILSTVQFRAERTTFSPRIHGVVDGVVDGPVGSPYAQIDSHGRYKVRVFFDEGDTIDGSQSTWIRMLQPHGGSIEGHHFPLRKGTEVHMIFLGGDPDRPIVAGVAPNTTKPSVVTQSNITKNMIRSGSNNYIEMEDLIGATHVHIFAPKFNSTLHLGAGQWNFHLTTDGDGRIHTGKNMNVDVDVNLTEDVRGTVTETYAGPFDTTVENAVIQTYQNTMTVAVTDHVKTEYKATLDYDVTGAATEDYANTLNFTVVGKMTDMYKAGRETTTSGGLEKQTFSTRHEQYVTGGQKVDVAGGQEIIVAGGQTITVTGNKTESVATDYALTVSGNLTSTINGSQSITVAGPKSHFELATFDWSVIGLKSSIFVGGQADLTVGAKLGIFVGVSMDISAALSMKMAPIELKLRGAKVDTAAVEAKTAGPKFRLGAIDFHVNGLKINT